VDLTFLINVLSCFILVVITLASSLVVIAVKFHNYLKYVLQVYHWWNCPNRTFEPCALAGVLLVT
jgi:hypothetical protein